MHPYSIDSEERRIVPFLIAVVAILLTWGIYWILHSLQISPPWWSELPSVMGMYGILFGVFDRWVWRWSPLRKIALIRTPIFAGEWKATLHSSFTGPDIEANVMIRQSWTHMEILLSAASSKSQSIIAALSVTKSNWPVLTYEYRNEPLPNAVDTMQIHYGTARLAMSGSGLEGEYYSGRGRQNYGSIILAKAS